VVAAFSPPMGGAHATQLARPVTVWLPYWGMGAAWNATQAEETFSYGPRRHRHDVWYEDARANYDRARLAAADGFAGIDLWYAGGEDPAVWPLLQGLYSSAS
jgi:spore germination protein YaaH